MERTESIFTSASLLLPKAVDLAAWAVIACDQFTSQPEYWQRARELTGGGPSALELILPEAELGVDDEARIAQIHRRMEEMLAAGLFREIPDSFIYVERTLHNGAVRRGLVGAVDLEAYDYSDASRAAVRATEKTVTERIPPRMRVRRGAMLELSHVLLLCDDPEQELLGPCAAAKDALPTLYDLELMLGGGRLQGRLVSGEAAEAVRRRLAAYEARRLASGETTLYAVGDGNHSLASAKACWEELKATLPAGERLSHPARYAMVELENLQDEQQAFAPIHRLVTGTDPDALLEALAARCAAEGRALPWLSGEAAGELRMPLAEGETSVAFLQRFLDETLPALGGKLDYIHGESALRQLAREPGAVGFLLPPLEKESLLRSLGTAGVLPRKSFSIGEAEEKRYYLEARRIL